MKEIKQNKNSSVIRFLAFVTALVVLVFSISIPAFAAVNYYENQPIPQVTPAQLTPGNGFVMCGPDVNDHYVAIGAHVGYDNVYCCLVFDGSNYHPYIISDVIGAKAKIGVYYGNVNSAKEYSNLNTQEVNLYNGWYYSGTVSWSSSWQGMINDLEHNVTVFTSIQDAITALDNSLNPGPDAHSFSGSLPAGNAIILDVSGNNAEPLSLSTSSALRHKDNWSDGNQMMGYFSTAPTSLNSPFDGTHSITWRGTGSPNLFGGYNTWNTTAPLLPTGNFLVIVNPAYPNDNPDSITSNQASNGSIYITCGYVLSATIVPLSSSWNNGSIVSSSGSIRLDGEYDPETDSWSFVNSSTGQPQNPVSGGLTDVDAEHITINDWLQNISHQIGSFFSGAIGAVSTLVSAGSDFIHSLSGLYAWLPAPVYSVLVSALILVITIGVIKVFI